MAASRGGPIVVVSFELPDGPVHQRILGGAASGRPPAIAYVGAANGDDPRWFERAAEAWRGRHGAAVARVLADPALRAQNEELLESADVIYLGSGDVPLLVRSLHAAGLTALIRRRQAQGALLFGVSAGAIALSRFWLDFPAGEPQSPSLLPCIGVLDAAIDCHDEGDDWSELYALLRLWGQAAPDAVVDAYGLPAGSALVFRHGRVDLRLGPPPLWLRLAQGRVERV
jgi:hypothetical protein